MCRAFPIILLARDLKRIFLLVFSILGRSRKRVNIHVPEKLEENGNSFKNLAVLRLNLPEIS
jgi:hypothetical protein